MQYFSILLVALVCLVAAGEALPQPQENFDKIMKPKFRCRKLNASKDDAKDCDKDGGTVVMLAKYTETKSPHCCYEPK
ncbi:hypothetical protein FQN57_001130 [Myotisia sp. PD_48]|nr:hypothetical protein FQN57_001130 [Myotisia sp. PD_48]